MKDPSPAASMTRGRTPLEDVGPAGVDKGRGGKYLILPPDYAEKIPADYIPLRSDTLPGLRDPSLQSQERQRRRRREGRRLREAHQVLPAGPGRQRTDDEVFVDGYGVLFDATIPYDVRFFESLDRVVQVEPWLVRDKAMIDILKSLGIEKGKSFTPNAKSRSILEEAAREAHAGSRCGTKRSSSPPFNEGTHWALPASAEVAEGMPTFFAKPNSYPTDGRGITYSMAYFSAKHLGAGQFYLMTIKDKEGRCLRGRAAPYRLTVPADAPVKLYWSATVYDRSTHALIRDQERSSRSSNSSSLQKNADGSVDVYFGPKAPQRQGFQLGPHHGPTGASKFCFASTGRKSPCSTRHGGCRTSRESRSPPMTGATNVRTAILATITFVATVSLAALAADAPQAVPVTVEELHPCRERSLFRQYR